METTSKRALIVDDEEAARSNLRRLLLSHPQIEIVGEAASAAEAISQFQRLKPDLIFLDVQMPKRDGFSILPELRPVPEIIFTTAYDFFAVKAFEVNAVDFLVKPIAPERLELALTRLGLPSNRKAKPFQREDYVFLFADQGLRVVLANRITHIEAAGNYSRVHVAEQGFTLIRQKMKEWVRLLPSLMFRRIDHSTLINLYAVCEILPLPHHHTLVTFSGSPGKVEFGRLASRRLRKAIASIAPP